MPTRQVDVTIAGKNTASGAFGAAGSDVEKFANRVQRMLNPLKLLKAAVVALGIASLGTLFRKATEAAIEHEKSLGRNLATLDRLKASWDYVLVRLGQAILGFDKAGDGTNAFTDALVGLGDWIDDNKDSISAFASTLVDLGTGLLKVMQGVKGVFSAASGNVFGASSTALDLFGVGPAKGKSKGFKSFLGDRDRAAQLAYETGGGAVPGAEGLDAILQPFLAVQEEARKKREALAEAFIKRVLTPTSPGLNFTRPEMPGMKPITDAAPALDTMHTQIDEVQLAFESLSETISGDAKDSIVAFADTWADATESMIKGTSSLGVAILNAGRKAVGGVLLAKGRETLLDAAKAAVEGFKNPIEFLRAARLFAIGTAQMAAGSLFAGGGGGGGGGLGASGFASQQGAAGPGDATIIIKGGVLDMNDPQQADALANALSQLSGRRVVVVGG